MNKDSFLTIGQLAKLAQTRSSTLRYYEKEGLLTPNGRSPSGYRLYKPKASDRLYFIQRAQRLGFSLADIRTLLAGWDEGKIDSKTLSQLAESRFIALEKQLTELLVMRHELDLFLQDVQTRRAALPYDQLSELMTRLCSHPAAQTPASTLLDWLEHYGDCVLNTAVGHSLLNTLRGQHVHIWQEDNAYHILIVSTDPLIGNALEQLTQLEANCSMYSDDAIPPQFSHNDEGFLLTATGESSFILARLFLALENESAS
ncbi:Transcriptional regulator, MerR family [hydrothermal vent metagenome]|uniref:Transcriptional regulator, MerR family n=1 Tax=hydrothermal vent metagenome TaxID=652676 RepID=A0A3B0UJL6_9ZZZZ